MGTFHDHKHELHGITVVVDTNGPEIHVGRCDDMDDQRVILLDVATHNEGDDGRTKEAWVARAAQFGVWPAHKHLVVDRSRVTSVRRLGEIGG